jgi:hypothetical protein
MSKAYCGEQGGQAASWGVVRDEGVAGSNPATPTSFLHNRNRHGERYGGRNAPPRSSASAAVLGRDDGEEHLTTKLRRAFRQLLQIVSLIGLRQGADLALALA